MHIVNIVLFCVLSAFAGKSFGIRRVLNRIFSRGLLRRERFTV